MTSKIKGSQGIEFPDSTVQSTAADAGPSASVQGSGQVIASSGISQVVTFETINFNTGGGMALNRFTAPVSGVYIVQASLRFAAAVSGLGERTVSVRRDGFVVATNFVNATSPGQVIQVAVNALFRLTAGAVVEITAYQSSGESLSLGTSQIANQFNIVKVGEFL